MKHHGIALICSHQLENFHATKEDALAILIFREQSWNGLMLTAFKELSFVEDSMHMHVVCEDSRKSCKPQHAEKVHYKNKGLVDTADHVN